MRAIRSLLARAVAVPADPPVHTAQGTMASQPLVLIDLVRDDGIVGRSYLRTYTPVALMALTRLVADLAEPIVGQEASPRAVRAQLERELALLGTQGLVGAALAGIDMALSDAEAIAEGRPLAAVLGAERESVAAYASLRSMAPEAAAIEARRAVERGFSAVKLKLGGGELADDLDAIRTIRRATPTGTCVMVDYNQSLTVDEAIRRIAVLDREGLAWIEEPTRADDLEGHARIAQAADTPIQLGENASGPRDIARIIGAGACDHLMLDAMRIGGVSGWMEAAELANAAGLPVSSHAFPEFSVHLLAASPTCHLLEYLDHARPILANAVTVEDGYVPVPRHPGAGLEWDEANVARWTVG